MSESEKPLLEFPTPYTLKALGRAADDFALVVYEIVNKHAPDCGQPEVRPSSKGSFVSVNITFTAESMDQLGAIHAELKASGRVSLMM